MKTSNMPFEFEMLNNFWSSDFNEYSNYERSKAYFIINRRFAIKHPLEAAFLSKVGINTGFSVKWIREYLKYIYSYKPNWLYTKTNSSKKETKQYKPSNELIQLYCKVNKCTRKDVNSALEFFNNEMKEEFEELEKIIKT